MRFLAISLLVMCFWSCERPVLEPICGEETLGGSGRDWFNAILPATDNGFVAVGYSSSADFHLVENQGNWDSWVCFLDDEFTPVSSFSLGSSGRDAWLDICPTADGNFFLAGYTGAADGDTPGNHGNLDVWVMKMSPVGQVLWSRVLGGSENDEAFDVEPLPDGSCWLAGHSESAEVGANRGSADIWALHISGEGDVLASETFGGSGLEYGLQIVKNEAGELFLGGYSFSVDGDFPMNNGGADFVWLRLGADGSLAEAKSFGGFGNEFLTAMAYQNGRFCLAGFEESDSMGHDIRVYLLDETGDAIATRKIAGEGDDVAFEASAVSPENWRILGYTASSTGIFAQPNGQSDAFEITLLGDGTVASVSQFGGAGEDFALSYLEASRGREIIVGMSSSRIGSFSAQLGVENAWIKCRDE